MWIIRGSLRRARVFRDIFYFFPVGLAIVLLCADIILHIGDLLKHILITLNFAFPLIFFYLLPSLFVTAGVATERIREKIIKKTSNYLIPLI